MNIPEVGRNVSEIGEHAAASGVRGVFGADLLEKYLGARQSALSSFLAVMSTFNIAVFAGMLCPVLVFVSANQLDPR